MKESLALEKEIPIDNWMVKGDRDEEEEVSDERPSRRSLEEMEGRLEQVWVVAVYGTAVDWGDRKKEAEM
jgi:hypothetical protein